MIVFKKTYKKLEESYDTIVDELNGVIIQRETLKQDVEDFKSKSEEAVKDYDNLQKEYTTLKETFKAEQLEKQEYRKKLIELYTSLGKVEELSKELNKLAHNENI